MELEYKDIELIETYLDGGLSAEDQEGFQARVVADPELKKNLEIQKLIREGVKGIGMGEFLAEINQWETEIQKREKVTARSIPIWVKKLSIAASILLVGIFLGNRYLKSQYSNEGIIAQNIQEQENQGIRGPKEVKTLFEIDVTDCNTAVPVFQAASPEEGEAKYVYTQMFLGHCYMKDQEYSKAAEAYQAALTHHQAYMKVSSVQLYKNFLLANIAMGKSAEEMEVLFQQVPVDATRAFIEEDIEDLRRKLNSPWRSLVSSN